MFSVAEATTADIGGLVYYFHGIDEGVPVEGATITLHRRNTQNGWDTFGSSTTTDSDGYYYFDDVDIGSGINGLCPNSDWFRVVIDASDAETTIPSGWDDVLYRYTKNEPQPYELPDTGWIRIDTIFVEASYTNPPVQLFTIWGVSGHFCYYDGEEVIFPENEDVICSCPPGENFTSGAGCIQGDWRNLDQSEDWSDEYGNPLPGQPDYGCYKFKDKTEPHPKLGEGYYYWDINWPQWALHQVATSATGKTFINIDFVDVAFPPE